MGFVITTSLGLIANEICISHFSGLAKDHFLSWQKESVRAKYKFWL